MEYLLLLSLRNVRCESSHISKLHAKFGENLLQIADYIIPEITFWHCLVISPNFFCARAHCGFTLIFQVSSKSVQVWGTNNKKTHPWPAKVKTRLLWAYNQYKVSTANTHTRTFNSPFSGTTQVSWYQKGKNQSGFYWSKRQWLAVASAGQYKSLHLAPDRQPHQHPITLFLQARCPSCRPTNSVKALKATEPHNIPGTLPTSEFRAPLISAT